MYGRRKAWPGVVALGLLLPGSADAGLDLRKVGEFAGPTYLAASADDRRRKFVTERRGTIRVVAGGKVKSRPFLNIKRRVSTRGEGGLLSMAFSPDYGRDRRFYVYYVDNSEDIRVDQFRAKPGAPNQARAGSRQRIIGIKSPPDTHKGGQLQMTESGYLLLATGDGGDFNNPSHKPQSKRSLLGKLLRIKPAPQRPGSERQYTAHPDNPFAGAERNGHGAILALGLRNPWRFSLDRRHPARVAIADVGHSRVEEVNYGSQERLRRANFGWPCYEGRRRLQSCRVKDHEGPVLTYGHGGGRCSITGGYVNRAPGLPRQGDYFYGDFCANRIWTVRLRRPRAGRTRSTPLRISSLVSFGEDARGNLYTVSLNGAVRRIVDR
jgi:hypothetical protein